MNLVYGLIWAATGWGWAQQAVVQADLQNRLRATVVARLGDAFRAGTLKPQTDSGNEIKLSDDQVRDIGLGLIEQSLLGRLVERLPIDHPYFEKVRQKIPQKSTQKNTEEVRDVFFADLGFSHGETLKWGSVWRFASPTPGQWAGDVSGFLRGMVQEALGSPVVIVLDRSLLRFFERGGADATVASGVLIHELVHVGQPASAQEGRPHPDAAEEIRTTQHWVRDYHDSAHFRYALDQTMEALRASAKVHGIESRFGESYRADFESRLRTHVKGIQLDHLGYFSTLEYPAYRAEVEFLKAAGLSFDAAAQGLARLHAASTRVDASGRGFAPVLAPQLYRILKNAYR